MAKVDKRAKRAKEKAKKLRLIKQKNSMSTSDKISVTSLLLNLFNTLPSPTERRLECFYIIKKFIDTQFVSDKNASLAVTFILYQEWFNRKSDSFDLALIKPQADQLLESAEFQAKRLPEINCLEAELLKMNYEPCQAGDPASQELVAQIVAWFTYLDRDPPIDNNDDFHQLRMNMPEWTYKMCCVYWKFHREITGMKFNDQPNDAIETMVREVTGFGYMEYYFSNSAS